MLITLVDISCYIFDLFILLIAFNCILQERKRIPKITFFACLIGTELIIYIYSLLSDMLPDDIYTFVTPIVSIITIFGATFLYYSPITHRIFLTLILQVFFSIAERLAYEVLIITNLNIIENKPEQAMIMGLLLSKCITFIFVVIMNSVTRFRKHTYTIQYTCLVLFLPLVTVFVLYVVPLPANNSVLTLPMYAIAMTCLLFANVVNFFLLNQTLAINELKDTKEKLNKQLSVQADNYQLLSSAYRNTRRAIHDTKKHFFYIQECVNTHKYDMINPYIKESIDVLEASYNLINTGNLVIDSFVSNYIAIAKEQNIEFISDIRVQNYRIPIKDFDLCVIIGNMLENSLHAVNEINSNNKLIEIHMYYANEMMVINTKIIMYQITIVKMTLFTTVMVYRILILLPRNIMEHSQPSLKMIIIMLCAPYLLLKLYYSSFDNHRIPLLIRSIRSSNS